MRSRATSRGSSSSPTAASTHRRRTSPDACRDRPVRVDLAPANPDEGANAFVIGFLPLCLPAIAFVAVLDVARMMIFEAVLRFLGLGVQPPTPTFGNIIADGRKYLLNAWWIATVPGVFLFLTLASLNLMGAALERSRNRVYGGAL